MRAATSYQLATEADNTGSHASIRSLSAGLVTALLVQQAMFGLTNCPASTILTGQRQLS